jgi:hypothetical protein
MRVSPTAVARDPSRVSDRAVPLLSGDLDQTLRFYRARSHAAK